MINREEDSISKILPKPDVSPDEGFKRALFQKLAVSLPPQKKSSTINFDFMNKFKFSLAGAAVVAVAFIIYVTLPKEETMIFSGSQEISKVNARAFGSLATLTSVEGGRGQGGGGNAAEADSKLMAPPGLGGGGSDMTIIAPVNYKFVYAGEKFTVDSANMPVYERQKGLGGAINLQSFMDRFNLGMLDINKFGNANVDMISASQNEEFGYMISVDFKQGSVYINQNWERWPQGQMEPMNLNAIPPDAEVIAIANQFLEEYGISRAVYGEPVVQNQWRAEYERTKNKQFAYVPDTLSIIYPLKISGNEIYDEGGNKSGLYVSVSLRTKRVSSVGELSSQRYDSSDYETEQDTAKLTTVAEQGGFHSYLPYAAEANVKTEELKLGTPILAYVRMWQPLSGTTRELMVPSLIFPVTQSGQGYYPQNIVVPVIRDVLNSRPWANGKPVEIQTPTPPDAPVSKLNS